VHVTHDIDEAVYLADRVLVLAAAPGRIVGSKDVALPRPRSQAATRSSSQFLALRNEIHALIAAERGNTIDGSAAGGGSI
jgi:ABC-type nitrate/sulfonate/bicarbonate transport system ATPase subunit